MEINQDSSPLNPTFPTSETLSRTRHSARYWLNHLFHCNPFYLISALLLLYGIYAISAGPHFLGTETHQIFFNFSSLELYSAMLVLTALMLARKKIWYDSSLLVVLECILIFVPFMLVSHATFLEGGLARSICLVGGLAAILKLGLFKRYFFGLNLPFQLLGCGVLILAANVALPLLFRRGLDFGEGVWTNNELWKSRSLWCWHFVLPAMTFLGMALPKHRPTARPLEAHEKQWLPLLLFVFWLCATGVHLYSIGYIDDQKFTPSLFVPVLWAASWLFSLRALPHIESLRVVAPKFLFLPAALPILAAFAGRPEVAVTLFLLNSFLFAFLSWRGIERKMTLWLAALSLLATLLSVPDEWMARWIAGYGKQYVILGLVAAAGLFQSIRSRTAKAALLGSISLGVLMIGLAGHGPLSLAMTLQISMIYALLHSLWWQEPFETGSDAFKLIVLGAWPFHSLALQYHAATMVTFVPMIVASALVILLAISKIVFQRCSALLAAFGGAVLLIKPGYLATLGLRDAPDGILPLIASFILFGLGTLFALNRGRIHRTPRPEIALKSAS